MRTRRDQKAASDQSEPEEAPESEQGNGLKITIPAQRPKVGGKSVQVYSREEEEESATDGGTGTELDSPARKPAADDALEGEKEFLGFDWGVEPSDDERDPSLDVPRAAKESVIELTDSSDDNLPSSPTPSKPLSHATPRGRLLAAARRNSAPSASHKKSHKAKARERDSSPEDEVFQIAVYYDILQLQPPSAPGRKGKAEKVLPLRLGPAELPSDADWSEFMSLTKIEVVAPAVTSLQAHTFTWRFMKPANSPLLPLINERGYRAMLVQAKPKKAVDRTIIVTMQPPTAAKPLLPWQTADPGAGPPGPDEDHVQDHAYDEDGTLLYQGKRDDILKAIAADLREKFAVGKCQSHPRIHCFYYRVSNLHWELTPEAFFAWAGQIKRKDATTLCPKIPSTFFDDKTALPKLGAGANTSVAAVSADVVAPAAPASVPTTPLPGAMPPFFPPYGGYPWAFPGYMSPAMPAPPAPQPPSTPPPDHSARKRRYEELGSSPVKAPISLEDFCAQYGIADKSRGRLEEMEFTPGDSISGLTDADIKEYGWPKNAWTKVCQANIRYKE